MEERWRDIFGWEQFYQISDVGNVRSKLRPRVTTRHKNRKQRGNNVLKHIINDRGYPCVNLTANGLRRQIRVHTAVLSSFIGPRPEGMECCHNDGNPLNITLENLRWDTRKNNHADKMLHGRWQACEKANNAKLNSAIVNALRSNEISDEEAALICNVTKHTAAKARRGESWKLCAVKKNV